MNKRILLSTLFIVSVIIFLTGCAAPAPEVVVEEEAEVADVEIIESGISEVDTLEDDLGTADVEEDLDSLEDFVDQI